MMGSHIPPMPPEPDITLDLRDRVAFEVLKSILWKHETYDPLWVTGGAYRIADMFLAARTGTLKEPRD